MKLHLRFDPSEHFSSGLLTVFTGDSADPQGGPAVSDPHLLTPGAVFEDLTAKVLRSGEFKASSSETLVLHAPSGLACERLLLVGVGSVHKLTTISLRQAAGTALRFAKDRGIRSVGILLPMTDLEPAAAARAIAEGVLLADLDTDLYRTDRKDRSIHEVTVFADATLDTDSCRAGFQEGIVLGESQNFARLLVLEPGNVLTPSELGRRACAMAAEVGLTCEVHSTPFLREQKMGAFLAVAQGSAEPPALVVLRYEPSDALPPDAPVIALVGKGITFDTGGISIKPADGMEKMKYDMAGAAAMLGAMRAIALLRPAVRVLCIVCSAENMPSGNAYKPGDVITAMSGKTIEVTNTDAEGRMVLADGLHYARTLGATHLIDAATLTGAIAVALGRLNAGLFSNDEPACSRFSAAAETTGEPFWRMPCTDVYRDQIKSQIADIQNTGIDRWGGAITAAMFLKEFVADTPWLHLDIAGLAWTDEARPFLAKGPTGIGVRTVAEWVRSYGVV